MRTNGGDPSTGHVDRYSTGASPGLVSTEVNFGRRPADSHAGFEGTFYLALNEIAYRN
jgi:hypothetical protein